MKLPSFRGPFSTFGLVVAGLVVVVDQALKLWFLHGFDLAARGPVRVLPVMDLVLVWNRGISYGMFQQHTTIGRLLLVSLAVIAAVVLVAWLAGETSRAGAAAYGFLIGGAVGNGIDRAVHGAVVDFVHLHYGTFSWYVFNLADAAIVVGVAILLYTSLWWGSRTAGSGRSGG